MLLQNRFLTDPSGPVFHADDDSGNGKLEKPVKLWKQAKDSGGGSADWAEPIT